MPTEFFELSRVLTGEDSLDEKLAGEYHERLHAAYPAELDALLAAFSDIPKEAGVAARLKERLDADATLAETARELIKIWFTSQFTGADKRLNAGTPDQWRAGLLWKVIQAPVPAATPGPYGYWAERPASSHSDKEA